MDQEPLQKSHDQHDGTTAKPLGVGHSGPLWRRLHDLRLALPTCIIVSLLLLGLLCHCLTELVRLGFAADGLNKLTARRYRGAASQFSFSIDHFRPVAHTYFLRAICQARLHRFSAGIQDLDRALVLGEPKARVFLTKAALKTEADNADPALRDYGEAIIDCGAAIDADPDNGDAYKLRGVCYERQKNFKMAVADCTKALELCSDPASQFKLHQIRGSAKRSLQQMDGAIQDLDDAMNIHANKELRLSRARTYFKAGLYQKAAQDYSAVLRLDQRSYKARLNRGLCEVQLGRPEAALNDFSKAVALNNTDSTAYLARGALWMDKQQLDLAVRDFKQALRLRPDSKVAKEKLDEALSNLHTRNRE